MKIDGHLLIETAIWEGERKNAMLFCPIEGESPYEGTSCTFFNEKGLVDTLKSLGFQTVHMELLEKRVASVAPPSFMKQFIGCLRDCRKAPEDPPPIKLVNRGVVHSIFSGFGKDTFTVRYWETIHDYHASHGGCTVSDKSIEKRC
jgi:hypothetical protein